MNKYLIQILILLSLILPFLINYNSCKTEKSTTKDSVYIKDTIEKILYRYIKPKPIVIIKTKEIQTKEYIESIEQGGGIYRIKTLNPFDSLQKTYIVKNFDEIQTTGTGIIIRENKIKWNGIRLASEIEKSLNENKFSAKTYFQTGITINQKYDLNFITGCDIINKTTFLRLNFSVTICSTCPKFKNQY